MTFYSKRGKSLTGSENRKVFSQSLIKLALRMEKGCSFKMKGGIKICRHGLVERLSGNNLAKFQPNWSSGC